ncbi:MAG: zinc ABC transporter substrate-binding protein [Candidatus Cloacimonadota bacterium]|nr:zinc ABC transporter substrate-binding protein [Candidatus Cloacimonadota bacterium]
MLRKKFYKLLLFLFIFVIGCKEKKPINILVSIAPHQKVLKQIVQDKANIVRIFPKGNFIHNYKIIPAQESMFKAVDVYYTVGIPAEENWIKRIKSINKDIKIVNSTKDIKIRKLKSNGELLKNMGLDSTKVRITRADAHGLHEVKESEIKNDIYTWMRPENFQLQINHMVDDLKKIDNSNSSFYSRNLKEINNMLDSEFSKFQNTFEKVKKSKHIVTFDRNLGYLLDDYSISQLPIFIESIRPNPGEISGIISQNTMFKTKAMFYNFQISSKIAKEIERISKTAVIQVDPFVEDYIGQMKRIRLHLDKSMEEK